MKKIFILALAIMSASFFSSCKASEQSAPGNFSSALVVVSGATEVKFSKYRENDQVVYKLRRDFPASGVIEEIKTEMTKQKWQPLKEDFLNPGIPSSMVRGWSEFADATKHPTMTVNQWISDWSNKNGEIVRYCLRYEYPEGKDKDLQNLKVYIVYFPLSAVEELQKSISVFRSKNKN